MWHDFAISPWPDAKRRWLAVFAIASVAAVARVASGESNGLDQDMAGLRELQLNASCLSPPPESENPQFICSVTDVPAGLPWFKVAVSGGPGGDGYTTGWKYARETPGEISGEGRLGNHCYCCVPAQLEL